MRTSRIIGLGIAAFAVVSRAGLALHAAQAPRARARVKTLADYAPVPVPGTPIQAAFVLQEADCSGNLRMLNALHRADVRESIHLGVIYYAGSIGDSTVIRSRLPHWASTTPLVPLTQELYAELKRLGHNSTPILIVLDQERRIRFTTQSPRTSREFAGLLHIIKGLTWIEEL